MADCLKILAKHEDSGVLPLIVHLENVARIAERIAANYGMDTGVARKGAVLHDIGKVSPLFQQTLMHGYVRMPGFIFRHEYNHENELRLESKRNAKFYSKRNVIEISHTQWSKRRSIYN